MDFFCKFCGAEHTDKIYPKTCLICNHTTWINPTPVAVLLQPVYDGYGRYGILIGRRNIEPHIDKWNLIGGYIDTSDKDVIRAAARELQEETGFIAAASSINLFWSFSDGRFLLIFCENSEAILLNDLQRFVPNSECTQVSVAWEPRELCFESHTEALRRWFNIQNFKKNINSDLVK